MYSSLLRAAEDHSILQDDWAKPLALTSTSCFLLYTIVHRSGIQNLKISKIPSLQNPQVGCVSNSGAKL